MTISTDDGDVRWSDNTPPYGGVAEEEKQEKRKQWTFLPVTGQKVGGSRGGVAEDSVNVYTVMLYRYSLYEI